ncbi:XRE family transcriptional regulator [Elizabethkingia anophelis]|uniref:HTH cro/C1-type domain-containing protein n=2 Tax=Elizabethkingia anophelis TaxID=1117645 RepID=A0A455ZFN0_9FLAO|nr:MULTISPECIES: helix-turn-helix transcriptional regulator [Elizabethkingia]ATC37703.1 XRE family transcriptional regulator [Elizabethkingia anophelis R26]ATC41383.1 XRE family transcriptional regulator [Elizabethkingia anophelis Ag1]ATC45060.1 XRE family transcriptional regulator [Elizabethkingia anophelis]ATC48736.1 XRE family transcriptional regulator [Elizabethkingia anophelis]ELR81179.1 helix-turn-helix domain-containing protein [Elizabethkingia anophelis R26]
MIKQLDPKKLSKLKRADDYLDEKYGKEGTPERQALMERAYNWYYTELIKDTRKSKKMTQQELADKIGKKREYISQLEQGKTDIQLSNFIKIVHALGLEITIS